MPLLVVLVTVQQEILLPQIIATMSNTDHNGDLLSFDEQAEEAIPADVRMISGCHDEQTSADVNNVGSFNLPDPAGRSGGACTSAILQGMLFIIESYVVATITNRVLLSLSFTLSISVISKIPFYFHFFFFSFYYKQNNKSRL